MFFELFLPEGCPYDVCSTPGDKVGVGSRLPIHLFAHGSGPGVSIEVDKTSPLFWDALHNLGQGTSSYVLAASEKKFSCWIHDTTDAVSELLARVVATKR